MTEDFFSEPDNPLFENTSDASTGRSDAMGAAARLLNRRFYSVRELSEKLLKSGFSQSSVEDAIQRLCVLHYLDDRAYAGMIVRSYSRRCCGPLRLKQELARRGIPKELAEEALAEAPDSEESLEAFLASRLSGSSPEDKKAIQRAVNAAMRRGFLWEQIAPILSRIVRSEDV